MRAASLPGFPSLSNQHLPSGKKRLEVFEHLLVCLKLDRVQDKLASEAFPVDALLYVRRDFNIALEAVSQKGRDRNLLLDPDRCSCDQPGTGCTSKSIGTQTAMASI